MWDALGKSSWFSKHRQDKRCGSQLLSSWHQVKRIFLLLLFWWHFSVGFALCIWKTESNFSYCYWFDATEKNASEFVGTFADIVWLYDLFWDLHSFILRITTNLNFFGLAFAQCFTGSLISHDLTSKDGFTRRGGYFHCNLYLYFPDLVSVVQSVIVLFNPYHASFQMCYLIIYNLQSHKRWFLLTRRWHMRCLHELSQFQ